MSDINLKPCPFCGGQAELIHNSIGFAFDRIVSAVKCVQCGARTRTFEMSTEFSCDDKAVEMWNTRYTEDTPSALPERFRDQTLRRFMKEE